MTDGPDWQPTFEAVAKVPGSKKQQPAKKTWEDRINDAQFARKRYSSDVAVGLGAVDTGDDFDPWGWLSGFSTHITDTLTENTDAIATLNEIAAAVATTAAYVSDLDDMATAPRINTCGSIISADVSGRPKYQDIITPQGVGGVATVYQHHGVTFTFLPEIQTGSATTGHIYYTPIVVDRRGVVEKLRWVVGSDSSIFSIDYYEMALCVYNPSNGNIEKVWGSGNIKDAEANVGSAFSDPAEAVITMLDGSGNPLGQQCQPGQILFVAHQQVAPGAFQSSRRMAAAATPRHTRTVPLLDAWCYVAPTYTEGIPSSISLASLTRENRFLPWEAVSVNALEPM